MESELLKRVVEEFSKLPSIGERGAMRLALHLLKQDVASSEALGNAIVNFRRNIKHCIKCNNISDSNICPICSDNSRDSEIICVVEDVKDIISIEATGTYNGFYHVLGGVISPMQGISPSMLKIDLLVENITNRGVKEVVLALPSSIEGDTTAFYIKKRVESSGAKVSAIAKGIGVGEGIDITDELTLIHALNNRISL